MAAAQQEIQQQLDGPWRLTSYVPDQTLSPAMEVTREPAKPASPVDHRGYALTWFAVAMLSFFAWIEYGRRRARELASR